MEKLDARPTQAPGVCFLCEMSNEVPHIDTLRNFDPAGPSNLRGRKYVCYHCIEEAAKLFEFLSPGAAAKFEAEIVNLKEEIDRLKPLADLNAAIKEAQEVIASGVAGQAAAQKPIKDTSAKIKAK